MEESEIAGLRGVHSVPYPVGLDEAHNVDDGEQDGENRPQHPDGPGVADVIGVVDLGRLLGGQHR